MTDAKTAALEKENASLNLIIEALVFENQALKLGYSVNEKVNGITEVLRPIPEKVDTIWDNIYKVREKLRATEKKVKYSASESNAKLLIRFHNKSNSDHPTLRKLTGLSEGAWAK
jgi:hypothetical protein